MQYDATYHRSQRLRAMARWAQVGVLERRSQLPVEQAFADRVKQKADVFFKPIAVNDVDSIAFHRELSYLIDAFDSLPWRVDIAFDSTWKAFELETSETYGGNATDRLKETAGDVESKVIERLCSKIPVQSCEYLFKRLVSDSLDGSIGHGLNQRILHSTDDKIRMLLNHLREAYGGGSAEFRRKGAMLLRLAMQGDMLTLGDVTEFRLDTTSRARILISLFLYTTRNERFHGESFSPFVSSAARLRTYTHPYFAFLSSYYLLLSLWMEKRPLAMDVDLDGLIESLDDNFKMAFEVFGRHWDK
ncbi:hypothetical protein [Corynebacterium marquesiae]|uniref:hypothetical protein n=1 Tax=Corynebacterium marquesiae TaxID=2913503 RepID=UPI0022BA3E37|nr:hypothetical protein [Corynebacterium marquesiae]MCZ9300750.1 hypothetical protein [Corynebacterium marquesiae]